MDCYTRIHFLKDGKEIAFPWVVDNIDAHPGFADAWDLVKDVAIGFWDYYTGNNAGATAAAGDFINRVLSGENIGKSNSFQFSFKRGGSIDGLMPFTTTLPGLPFPIPFGPPQTMQVDELHIWFRAWSDDDLTTSSGKLVTEPSNAPQFAVLGERKWDENDGDTHLYEIGFTIPISQAPEGAYGLIFGSGDDGWFYDVGVINNLGFTVLPAGSPTPHPLPYVFKPTSAQLAAIKVIQPPKPKTTAPEPVRKGRPLTMKQVMRMPYHSKLDPVRAR